jgi:hypothetical protein
MRKGRALFLFILTALTITVPLFVNLNYAEASTSVIPYTGVSADYCLYFDNGAMSVWTQDTIIVNGLALKGHVDLLNLWKPMLTVSKMGFTFPNAPQRCSYYDEGKWETLLQLFTARGVKVIAQFYPSYNSLGYCGSSQMTTDWLKFIDRWKGDSRIAAVGLYEEPTSETQNKNGNVKDWNVGLKTNGVYDRKLLAKYFVSLTHQIHSHDPNRVVIFPWLALSYYNQNELFADFEAIRVETGVNILTEPNTIFDVVHPYLFDTANGGDVGMDPAIKASNYESNFIVPWYNKVGSAKIHCGETFMFTKPCAETGNVQPNMARQSKFLTSIINVFVKYRMGFQLLNLLQWSPDYKPSGYTCIPYNVHRAAFDASNYASATPTPTPAPTPTPTPTPKPTVTPTPTPKPTPTPTPTPSPALTPTPTPAPTATPVPLPTPSPSSAPTPTPTLAPADGLDSNDLGGLNGNTTSGITEIALDSLSDHGIYSDLFSINRVGGTERIYVYKNVASEPEICVRGYYRIESKLPTARTQDRVNLVALKSKSKTAASFTVHRNNETDEWTITSTAGTWTATKEPASGNYSVEFYTKINSTDVTFRMWIDGKLVIEQTELNAATLGNVDSVQAGSVYVSSANRSPTIYSDCLVVSRSGTRVAY